MAMATLPLDYDSWDIKLDAAGNWSVTRDVGDVLAQTVANAWLLFTNESVLFPTEGIPYQKDILSRTYPRSLVSEHLHRRAMEVPGVVRCKLINVEYVHDDRVVMAEGLIYDAKGNERYVRIG